MAFEHGHDLRKLTGKAAGLSVQLTALDERHRVLAQTDMIDTRRLADAAEVLKKDHRILWNIVARGLSVRINHRKITVDRRKDSVVFQPLEVAAQGFIQIFMLFSARGEQLLYVLFESLHTARRQIRQNLAVGEAGERLERPSAALRADVEVRHRVHLIAEKFDADRIFLTGGEYVQNTAAHRELSGALDLRTATVARAHETQGQLLQLVGSVEVDGECGALEHLRRHTARQQCRNRDHDRTASAAQSVEHGDAPVFVLARGGFHIVEHKIAVGKNVHRATGEALEVARHTGAG